jgi:hypothetical protein
MLPLVPLMRLVGTVQLVGPGHCPDPVEVEARLRTLSEPGADETREVGTLEEVDAGRLRLRLLDAQGKVLRERSLAVGSSCAARIQASAVIFATWQAQLATAPPAFPEARVEAAPPRETAPTPLQEAQVSSSAVPPKSRGLMMELRAGLGAGWAADQVEPGFRLEAALLRPGGHWSAELGVTAELARQEALGAGIARWTRSSLALSAGRRFESSSAGVQVEAGAVLTFVSAQGFQLPVSRRASAMDAGVRAGVRCRIPGKVTPWLLLDGTFWPLPGSLAVQVRPVSHPLPFYEIGLVLGGSFSLDL